MTLQVISGGMAETSWVIASLRLPKFGDDVGILGFEVAPEKEIARGQIWQTRRSPGNISLRIPSER
jgi:hypothetical protein